MKEAPKPKHPLETYRDFIRDASPYVSVVMGRKIRPEDAEKFSEKELEQIALLIDSRADELNKKKK